MAVAQDGVDVEGIRQRKFPGAQFESSHRHLRRKREKTALLRHGLIGEANGLVEFDTRHVGRWTQVGIANHIEIGEASQTERLTQTAAAGIFLVIQHVGFVAGIFNQLVSEEERRHFRGFVLEGSGEAVAALVR